MVVPPGGAKETEKAFEALADASLRTRLATNARSLAEREFDLRMLGRRLADFLVSLH
jgi:hypothetical protein